MTPTRKPGVTVGGGVFRCSDDHLLANMLADIILDRNAYLEKPLRTPLSFSNNCCAV